MSKQTTDTSEAQRFEPSVEYFFTVISSWLIPGAGHWLLGYKVRGALQGLAILGLFWVGQAMAVPLESPDLPRKPMAVSKKVSPVFFACQMGNGFSTLLSNTLWGDPRGKDQISRLDASLPPRLNLGILFTSVSGLLNALLVIHIMDPRTWVQAASEAGGSPAEGPES